jgi:predicted lipoprotein with Yx(FWY)xxD motif
VTHARLLLAALALTLVVAGCTQPALGLSPTATPVQSSSPAAVAATAVVTSQSTTTTTDMYAQSTTSAVQSTTSSAVSSAAATTVSALFAPLPGQSIVKTASDPKLGDFLVAANGLSLYLYTKDAPNTSNCYDQCATNWPPLLVSSGDPTAASGVSGQLGTTTRKDGSKQVTYNGVPLYFWAKDAKPGDTLGQGVGNVWFVVPPTATGFPTVKTTKDANLGVILTDLKGMTLYRFTNDQGSTSNCNGTCAQNWPPLLITSGQPLLAGGLPGTLGTTTRQDGSTQVTYNGVPLYYFAKDAKAGDTTGQGVNNIWFVVEAKAGS